MVGVTDQAFFMNCAKKLEHITGLDFAKALPLPYGYKLLLPNKLTLTREGLKEEIAFFPKVSPDFSQAVYLFNEKLTTAALNSCGMRLIDLKTQATNTIIEDVEEDGPEFTGINGSFMSIARYNWISDDSVAFTTYHHQTGRVFVVSIVDGKVRCATPKHRFFNCEATTFLSRLSPNVFLCKRDCLFRNGLLFVVKKTDDHSFVEVQLERQNEHQDFEYFEENINVQGVESTFYGKKDETIAMSSRPMILFIHGGPHNIWPNVYNPVIDYFVRRNHTVLNTNYMGSTGRGAKFARELIGNAGTKEIDQVY